MDGLRIYNTSDLQAEEISVENTTQGIFFNGVNGAIIGSLRVKNVPSVSFTGTSLTDSITFNNLGFDADLVTILHKRYKEYTLCFEAQAYLASIVMLGSIIEAVLLGITKKFPKEFNESPLAPKDKARLIKKFSDWKLSDFINVAENIGFIKEPTKKFSDVVREYRNYIHPSKECSKQIEFDKDSAIMAKTVLSSLISELEKKLC